MYIFEFLIFEGILFQGRKVEHIFFRSFCSIYNLCILNNMVCEYLFVFLLQVMQIKSGSAIMFVLKTF